MQDARGTLGIGLALIVISALMNVGCSSSEEAVKPIVPAKPSATEVMQSEMNNLRTENESLKNQITKLQQENRTAKARIAELETYLSELNEKLTTVPPPPPRPIVTDAHESYDKALQLFHQRKYQEAAATFRAILNIGIETILQDNCYYWLGECAYGEKNYNQAIEHFEKLFTFPISDKKDDAQMMIANCYKALGDNDRAKAEYKKLIEKFPASPYIERAKVKLQQLQ